MMPKDRVARLCGSAALAALLFVVGGAQSATAQTWTADNGNGTYSNPLFYDEFADPDIIRIGSDFYLLGSSMHVMPGLAVLHSRDLVNWEFESYASTSSTSAPSFASKAARMSTGRASGRPASAITTARFTSLPT
jgi:xylan 1,4-beta-xylosidase